MQLSGHSIHSATFGPDTWLVAGSGLRRGLSGVKSRASVCSDTCAQRVLRRAWIVLAVLLAAHGITPLPGSASASPVAAEQSGASGGPGITAAAPAMGNQKEQVTSANPETLADSLNLFYALFRERKFRNAEGLIRGILPYAEREYGGSSEKFADLLDRMVASLYQTGKDREPETHELADRALSIRLSLYGEDDARTVRSMGNIGVLHAMAGRLDEADSVFTAGLSIMDGLDSPDPRDIGRVLSQLANVRMLRSDLAGSIPLSRRSLAILEQLDGPRHPRTLTIRSNLASLLTIAGDYAQARDLLDLQIEILESAGSGGEELARVYSLLADVSMMIGDSEEQLRLQRQALRIRESCHATDHPEILLNKLAIGVALGVVGRMDEAYETIREARESWLQHRGSDDPHSPNFDRHLGTVLVSMGRTREAREALERAVDGHTRLSGENAPKTTMAYVRLARLLMQEGEHSAAREFFARAVGAAIENYGADSPVVGTYGNYLAQAHFLEGNLQEAFEQALAAETIITRHTRMAAGYLPERQALLNARRRGAPLDLALSLADAVSVPDAVPRLYDAVIKSRSVVLDEMAGRNRRPAASGGPDTADLWEEYEQASSRLANLFLRNQGEADPEKQRQLIDGARRAMEDAQRKLPGSDDSRRWLTQAGEVGWTEIADALPPGSALVSYILHQQYDSSVVQAAVEVDWFSIAGTTPHYRALILPPYSETPVVLDIGSTDEVDALIAEWQREASLGAMYDGRDPAEALRIYEHAAGNLRERIWDAVAPFVKDASKIFVVPDGQIHLVNLGSLTLEDGRYLIESAATIHYLTAERDLARPSTGESLEGFLVLGAPDFESTGALALAEPEMAGGSMRERTDIPAFRSAPPQCDYLTALRFAPLPDALDEANEVAMLWESSRQSYAHDASMEDVRAVRLLTGSAASEEAFKQLAPQAGIIHLATHGFFLSSHCPSGFTGTRGIGMLIPESDEVPMAQTSQALTATNPLLLSGLALAGANQRLSKSPDEEDGILTAQEIAALDLSGVRWAVLSACESGTGQVLNGEGIFGLRRAFEIAGARTLVTSLWSVQDKAARKWMNEFYKAAMDGSSPPADAARAASLAVLQNIRDRGDIPHPSEWAAFVASGDWR